MTERMQTSSASQEEQPPEFLVESKSVEEGDRKYAANALGLPENATWDEIDKKTLSEWERHRATGRNKPEDEK